MHHEINRFFPQKMDIKCVLNTIKFYSDFVLKQIRFDCRLMLSMVIALLYKKY